MFKYCLHRLFGIKYVNNNHIQLSCMKHNKNKLPYQIAGIYFLDGNKTSDYFATLNTAQYNENNNKLILKVSHSDTFIFDGIYGLISLFFCKLFDLKYIITFNSTYSHGTLQPMLLNFIKIPKFIFYGTFDVLNNNYTIWDRKNYLFYKCEIGNYKLRKIINSDNEEIEENMSIAQSKIEKNVCRFTSAKETSIIDLPSNILNKDTYIYCFKKFQLYIILSQHYCFIKYLCMPLLWFCGIIDMLLLVSYKERKPYFSAMRRICGNPFPYGYGLMYCDYYNVSNEINSKQILKAARIGTIPVVIPDCFGPKTLIFLNGEEHNKYRELYKKLIPTKFDKEYPQKWFEDFYNSIGSDFDLIKLIIRIIFFRVLEIDNLSDTDIEEISKYEKNRLTILFPQWLHNLTCRIFSRKISTVRKNIVNIVKKSQFGIKLKNILQTNLDLDENEFLYGFIDILLFAGVIGTKHLVKESLLNLKKYSIKNNNIHNFIRETARLNPPVTSINSVNAIGFGEFVMNSNITIPRNMILGWCISEANTDYLQYKNPLTFNLERDTSGILSWNGSGFRKCIGEHLSMEITGHILKKTFVRSNLNDTFIYRFNNVNRKIPLYERFVLFCYCKLIKMIILKKSKKFKNYKYTAKRLTIPDSICFNSNSLTTEKQNENITLLSQLPIELNNNDKKFTWIDCKTRDLIAYIGNRTKSKFKNFKEAKKIIDFPLQKGISIANKMDLTSPDGLYKFFTEDIGILLLEKMEEESDNNLIATHHEMMEHCKIKDGRQDVQFLIELNTTDKKIIAMEYNNKSVPLIDDDVFRFNARGIITAAIANIILVNHFFNLHKLNAEAFAVSLHKVLSEKHPIFKIMYPHTINLFEQNDAARKFLFDWKSTKGTLHQFLPIDSESHAYITQQCINNFNIYKLISFTEFNTDLANDAKLFYNAIKEYISNMINYYYKDQDELLNDVELFDWFTYVKIHVPNTQFLAYTNNSIIDLISIFIFSSSVLHEIAGAALLDFYHNPFTVSPSLLNNGFSHYDTQSYAFEVALANVALYGTAIHAVSLRNDYSQQIGTDEESIQIVKTAWSKFEEVHKIIIEKNKTRKYKQDILSMDSLEYSIAT